MINLNITLAIQLVNFFLALVILNYVLIKPIRGILQKRRDIVSGLIRETGKQTSEASERIQRYEADLEATRAAAAEQRDVIKQHGLDAEQSILSEAQSEAHNFLHKSRREIEHEVAVSLKILRGQVDALAGKVVAKVLE